MREKIFEYVLKQYGTSPEYPWSDYPNFAVLRHRDNKKWYGLIGDVERSRLGLEGTGKVDVINIKLDPILVGSLQIKDGFFPAYHMNKQHWISILLDGSSDLNEIKSLIDMSYDITKKKRKVRKNMVIRRAEKKDIKPIMDLLLQVLTVHHNGRPDYFKSNCRKYTDAELAEIIADDARPIFVYDEGGVKGYCFCIMQETRGDNARCDMKSMYIDDLCVDENERGRHIGKSLYEYAREYAKNKDCYNLTLNVWECNPSARRFYDSIGLKPLKTTLEMIL